MPTDNSTNQNSPSEMQVEPEPQPPRLEKPVRLTEQVWPDETPPVVSIFCITYNHAKFIRDAIDGFLIQETTFPVEIFIHDDASVDGTAEIIKEYAENHPSLFRIILQTENQWSQGNRRVLFELLKRQRGQFIAFCEGDDFWITADKLEKQVAVLHSKPDILFCGGGCGVLDEKSGKIIEVSPPKNAALQQIRAGNYFPGDTQCPWIHNCTRVFPKSVLSKLPESFGIDTLMLHWLVTKYPMHEIVIVPGVVATYRMHAGGIWSGMDTSTKDRALVGIYSKAASLHKDGKKDILLKRAIEHAELAAKSDSGSAFPRLFWALKLFYLKSFRSVYHFFATTHTSKRIERICHKINQIACR